MKSYCIYYHKSPDNRYYIGQTCQLVQDRWRQGGTGYKKQEKFYSAILQIGWDNFEHKVIEENIPQDKIDEREAYYIALFDAVENGFNTYKQNYNGYHFADLWADPNKKAFIIAKLTAMRNTPQYHEEQSQRMSELWQTKEYRQKQKDSWTNERRLKTSEMSKNNWKNEDYRKNLIPQISNQRKIQWRDPEYRKKMCQSVICIETQQIFPSVKAAAEWCGVKANSLSSALKSATHQSGRHPESNIKLHWRKVEEYFDEVGKEGSPS